jgi:hypothetical protein
VGTTDTGFDVRIGCVCVLLVDKVPLRAVVADETTGLLAGIEERLYGVAPGFKEHLSVMLVAKYAKVSPRTGTAPFPLACRFYMDLAPATPGHLSNSWPTSILRGISAI